MSALQVALGDESTGIVVSHVVPRYWKTAIEVVRDYHGGSYVGYAVILGKTYPE